MYILNEKMLKKTSFKNVTDGLDGKPVTRFDVKGWLILYNILLDRMLSDVRSRAFSTSIAWSADLHEIERHVLMLEDRRFFRHHGFDVYCIARIFRQLISFRKIGGVSTIEQQCVRTYLNRRERSFSRKFHEVAFAWLMSHRMEKAHILRAYLSIAYFGYRLNGCDQAAELLFGKPASELKAGEAALVASLLVYPLPKSVVVLAKAEKLLPLSEAKNEFFARTQVVAPWWTARIRIRTAHSMRLIRNSQEPKE